MDKGIVWQALKDAQHAAIGKIGGIVRAAKSTGVCKSMFQRYMDRANPAHMSVVTATLTDIANGEPVILREMARLQGFDIVRVSDPLPLVSLDAADQAHELHQLVAATHSAMHGYERGQKTPRHLQSVMSSLHRTHMTVGRMLDVWRVMASKQRETA